MRNLLVVLLVVFFSGCATMGWKKVLPERYIDKALKFSADLPMGWMRFAGTKIFTLTKDGVVLDAIYVERTAFNQKLITKKQFKAGMLPYELAEVQIDNFKSQTNIRNLEIISNENVNLAGKDAFKVVCRFQTVSGLWKKAVHYGFIHGGAVYSVLYEAAEQYYYDKNEKAFNDFIRSFSI